MCQNRSGRGRSKTGVWSRCEAFALESGETRRLRAAATAISMDISSRATPKGFAGRSGAGAKVMYE